MIKHLYIAIIFLCISCSKDDISKRQRIITATSWKIYSYADLNTGYSFSNDSKIYSFYNDGKLEIKYNESLYSSTWSFIDNENYIQIGSNTYYIQSISKNLLGLRYGNIEIFYTPAK